MFRPACSPRATTPSSSVGCAEPDHGRLRCRQGCHPLGHPGRYCQELVRVRQHGRCSASTASIRTSSFANDAVRLHSDVCGTDHLPCNGTVRQLHRISSTGDELKMYGLGLVQNIDAAAMELYVSWRHFEAKDPGGSCAWTTSTSCWAAPGSSSDPVRRSIRNRESRLRAALSFCPARSALKCADLGLGSGRFGQLSETDGQTVELQELACLSARCQGDLTSCVNEHDARTDRSAA